MTTPDTQSDRSLAEPKAESFMDWFHVNSRWVGIAAVAVVAAAAIAWYIPTQKAQKARNADKQLLAAKQSLSSGNAQLAESDLKKVADRYASTAAGVEAGLLLAQMRLEKGDAPGAVAYLKELAGKVTKGPNAPSVVGLLGDAYSQAGKPAEAAAEYERAAGLTEMPNEKALYTARAGRSYMDAGRTADARRIWELLAAKDDSQGLATEARIRLGELSAVTAAR